jgi:uncharacterized protein (TIGR02757 family)
MDTVLQKLLHKHYTAFNSPNFIPDDPITIPHRFTQKQDIEIAGFFAAILAWGNRKSIINSCNKLLGFMNNEPYQFIMQKDLDAAIDAIKGFHSFVHRTFNALDLYHLLQFLHHHYYTKQESSLETAFTIGLSDTKQCGGDDKTVAPYLINFYNYVFGYSQEAGYEKHCRKHIATPAKKSACKRLNMYLRWMVRNDDCGVDFGLWRQIKTQQLICPLDVHVSNTARKLGLLQRTQNDWQAAVELTEALKQYDANDPVKYDFALFGIGVNGVM